MDADKPTRPADEGRPQHADHPDEFELDALRTGEAGSAVAEHVSGCDACRDRLAALETLAGDLAAASTVAEPPVTVPEAQDAAILALASATARRIRGRRRHLVALGALAAAAAVVLMLVWNGPRWPGRDDGRAVAFHPHDVNRDGEVDILDAFALARTVDRAGDTRDEWDFNRDRVVDGGDVSWLGARIVAISEDRP